jgi:very-short-patch-repair endonuclease
VQAGEEKLTMHYQHNTRLTPNARKLRKEMTDEERKLWYLFLRHYPIRFLRQKVIDSYIVDFYCAQAKLVVEIDGTQHYEEQGERKDKIRDEKLKEKGLMVVRFSNLEINQEFQEVCEQIDRTVKERMGLK